MVAPATPKGLCIVTRCTSTDELVARLHPFCGDTSIFVTTSRVWEVGTASRFAITLADKTVVLHGRCTVIGAWSDSNNPFGRPGVRLELVELAGNSRAVFERMQENRKAGEPVVKPHPMVMVPMPNEISDAFARATSSGMPSPQIPMQLDDGPTDRTEQPEMLRPAMIVGRAVVSHAITLDTTARSSSPPMPPRIAKSGAKPPPPPSPRAAFGSPLHGNVPLGTPLPTRRARGTDSIVGRGPCPGTNDLDPDTIVQKAAPVTVLTVDTVRLAKKVPPLAVELPPPSPIARLANGHVTTQPVTLEVRTPGSPYVLPANPLTGLSDAALFGFVDCTLYEDPAGEDDPTDGAVGEPIPVTPSTVNRVLAELEPAASGPVKAVEPAWSGPVITVEPAVSGPVITIEPAISEPVITIEPAVSEPVITIESAVSGPHEEPAMIHSLAPTPAPLPTIESRAARLPWRSIGRITGVVAIMLMTAFLILFQTGGW
ncbi:MAG TPA: hypothetical protein VIU61_08440 [Kofleriaceae bacterium]